jgi:hypothetical protein
VARIFARLRISRTRVVRFWEGYITATQEGSFLAGTDGGEHLRHSSDIEELAGNPMCLMVQQEIRYHPRTFPTRIEVHSSEMGFTEQEEREETFKPSRDTGLLAKRHWQVEAIEASGE